MSKPKIAAPLPAPDLDDLADLKIDLSDTAPAKPGIAQPPTPGAFSPFDDDFSSGPSLELDTQGGSLPPRISSPSVSNPPSMPSMPAAPVSQRTVPQAPAASSAAPAVDPFEAKVLADYGQPGAFYTAPIYAYRVVTRRSALRRDLVAKKSEADRTQKRVEDALVSLGERARALAKGGSAALDRVKQAEDLLRGRDGALAGAMDAYRAAVAEIDGRLSAAEAELARARQDESRASSARDVADEEHKRADAKVKRIEIEMRNGAQRAAERDAAAAEVAQKLVLRTQAEQALGDARRVAVAAQAKVDAIARERTTREAAFSRQSGTRSAGVDDAQTQLRAALVDLGRAMLADPSVATELAAARDEVARLEDAARKHAHDVTLHEHALVSYDAPKVFLGLALVGVALLLVLVVLFFPMIYHSLAS
jgi:hypothetical protein